MVYPYTQKPVYHANIKREGYFMLHVKEYCEHGCKFWLVVWLDQGDVIDYRLYKKIGMAKRAVKMHEKK